MPHTFSCIKIFEERAKFEKEKAVPTFGLGADTFFYTSYGNNSSRFFCDLFRKQL